MSVEDAEVEEELCGENGVVRFGCHELTGFKDVWACGIADGCDDESDAR